MQVAVAEFARHVAGMEGANSTEFDPETPYPVIDLLPEQKEVSDLGGTMRLGADPVKLHEGTRVRELYGEAVIYERHRHRYEVNNHLRAPVEAAGLVVLGHVAGRAARRGDRAAGDEHPFFVASQYHPEFKSRPERPAPLFRGFVARRARPRRAGAARAAAPAQRGRRARDDGVRRADAGRAPRAQRAVRAAVRDREPVRARARAAPTASPAELRGARAGGRGGRRRGRGRRRCGQPARAHPRRDGADARRHPAVRPPRHRPADRAGRAGAARTACGATRDDAILGADNKAAVAVMLAGRAPLGRRAAAGAGRAAVHRPRGARARRGEGVRRRRRLRSRFGYVFDHASPIGEIVLASPNYHRIDAEFHGVAAHAGIRPEDGRSAIVAAARAIAAMPLGRLDDETTANVGTIAGGTGVNVVPERCRVEAEARSLDEQKVEAVVAEIVDHLHDGANAARVRRRRQRRARCSTATARDRARRRCASPRRRCAPAATSRGRSSPAAARTPTRSSAAGFPCTNLANGTERNHQPDERVSVAALEGMLDVALALLDEPGRECDCPEVAEPGLPPREASCDRRREARRASALSSACVRSRSTASARPRRRRHGARRTVPGGRRGRRQRRGARPRARLRRLRRRPRQPDARPRRPRACRART